MTSTLLPTLSIPRLNFPTVRQLTNGLTIVAEQMPVEAVNLSLWIDVGSAVETHDINGMAHFLEHMVFKGTEKLLAGEFERQIEERGAVTNAATSQDYTHYYITTAPKDFADLAPLQIDVVLNPSIPDAAFDRERLVVLEEIRRAEDNPRRRTYQKSVEMAFEVLPYRRPILGPAAVVENLTPQQMRDFHAQWYQPSSITAVAVGNLPVEELIDIVADGFYRGNHLGLAPNSAPTGGMVSPLAKESAFTEIVREELVDDSLQQARLVMVWRVPGLVDIDETYALDVLSAILGRGRTSRLVQDLRETRGLVSSISASNMTYRQQGIFYISATLPSENVDRVEAIVLEHLRSFHQSLVTEAEIARVRTQVANRFIFGNETPSDRANLYGYYQSMLTDLAPALNYPDRIQAIHAPDIQLAAQKYLPDNAYGILIVRPKA
ncbi:pitrilysin family protein [[Phormidium] sp. ETS-05]|uniref:M16 family metallopeptidase n=1 Tax=[Phormidium] sp. ETS-05 TaxID=222819 RepID=UPI0018EECF07|nr:pitrilysin family protein [[Phormidium] sp. ETS-05]